MITTFELTSKALEGLIAFCGADAVELKKKDTWRILSVRSLFRPNITAYFFESQDEAVLVLARMDQAAQVKQFIEDYDPKEVLRRIRQLEKSPPV
jgi:hypothetical protein